ncbi:alpha/beta hydrolase [Paraburkholderia phenazinium]|jgi:enterochelin esterase-like enzyme|uniref:Enterochelin esterase n=1 Tax=Paraburkholderia phenazinium TaxID=60549 RepID=A0A1G8NNG5_9BURK|nr:alpha/beta hydrolase-fold protein [Paraburkholderia phenazinium]SDI81789.1 Enterochelin esterase [Paraburkholderia phenazinium]
MFRLSFSAPLPFARNALLGALAVATTIAGAVATAASTFAALAVVSTSALASTVASRSFHAAALERDWAYTIYLPTGYHANGAHYPVLYLLHGNNGNANDWITQGHLQSTADALIARKEIPPVVIVMPQGGTDWYVDRKEKMETAFFNDLLPEVETQYAVANQRAGRMIGGVSMGGFGALRYAMTRPDQFCSAMLLSPAIYPNEPPLTSAARRVGVFGEYQFDPHVWHALNYPAQWEHYMKRPYRLPMFIGAGDDDLTIQADASVLYTNLRLAGNPAALRIIDGAHTWDVWSALLPAALKYTLACAKPAAQEPENAPKP